MSFHVHSLTWFVLLCVREREKTFRTLQGVLELQHLVDEPRLLLQLSLVLHVTCGHTSHAHSLVQRCKDSLRHMTALSHHHLSSWWSTRLPFWNAGLRFKRTLQHTRNRLLKRHLNVLKTARNTMPAALYGSRDRKQLISGFWFRRVGKH